MSVSSTRDLDGRHEKAGFVAQLWSQSASFHLREWRICSLILAFTISVCAVMAQAGEADDPARKRVTALGAEFYQETYVKALRTVGCRVDFKDKKAVHALFDLFLADVYKSANVSKSSQENRWVEGDALSKKDDAFFALEKQGRARFNSRKKIMTLTDC